MTCLKKLVITAVVGIGLLSIGAAVFAQDQQSDDTSKSKPAARVYPPVGYPDQDPSGDQASTPPLQADTGPLTGVQNPTLGSPEVRHSYWVPGIQYSNAVFSNSVNPSTNSGWNSTNYVTGNLSLLQGWRDASLSVNYSGGGYFSNGSAQGNGQFQQLALGYQLDERRWQLLFMDQFAYLPESSFGFGASTGLALPGIGGSLGASVPGLQGSYAPSQSIFASVGPRYSDTGTAQLTYQLSARNSITLAGVYGILRFVDPGNVESNNPSAVAGYNHTLSRKDSIGVSYRFSAYQYVGNPQALGDHVAQVVYGRKITGRMALQLAGGPDFTTFRIPISGLRSKLTGSGNATLTYAFKGSSVSLNYSHGLSGGSGVLVGSSADQIGVNASRRLSRTWQGNLNFSYARNSALNNQSGLSSSAFDTWYAGAGLARQLGRATNFSIAYQAQNQKQNLSPCSGTNCSTSYLVNQIILSFQWHTPPLVIR